MSKTEMPAAEANSYELAFHVLPTVAEGEVATVFQSLKDTITKRGGTITTEEAPARFDLAYEIIKYLEGRNRKFSSAYFGWVRFTTEPESLEKINHDIEEVNELLRHMVIKLTKTEEANPFFFHEALAAANKSETIDTDEALAPAEESKESEKKAETAEENDKEAVEETKESDETEKTEETEAEEATDGDESKDKV